MILARMMAFIKHHQGNFLNAPERVGQNIEKYLGYWVVRFRETENKKKKV